jgi:hypothetical protein
MFNRPHVGLSIQSIHPIGIKTLARKRNKISLLVSIHSETQQRNLIFFRTILISVQAGAEQNDINEYL